MSSRTRVLDACALSTIWALEPPSLQALTRGESGPPPPPRAVSDLRSVTVAVSDALVELQANAITALGDAAALRDAALAGGAEDAQAAYDALAANIESALRSKTAALEAELVACDANLERTEAELADVASAASTAPDGDLAESAASALLARLDRLFFSLRDFPRGPVEEPTLSVVSLPPGALCLQVPRPLGCLLLQHAPPEALTVRLPPLRRIKPGSRVDFDLLLPASTHSPDAAVASLVQRTAARASLRLPSGPAVPLSPLLRRTAGATGGITVSFVVPADAPVGSTVFVESLSVARSPPGEPGRLELPCEVSVHSNIGIEAPFTLASLKTTRRRASLTTGASSSPHAAASSSLTTAASCSSCCPNLRASMSREPFHTMKQVACLSSGMATTAATTLSPSICARGVSGRLAFSGSMTRYPLSTVAAARTISAQGDSA